MGTGSAYDCQIRTPEARPGIEGGVTGPKKEMISIIKSVETGLLTWSYQGRQGQFPHRHVVQPNHS